MKQQLKYIKSLITLVCVCVMVIFLASCQPKEAANEIKVGTIAGPETELMQVAKNVAAKKYNLIVTIVPFTDYTMPNQALNDGEIDANMFQTIAYLNADLQARHYPLTIVGKTFIYPMAIYSQKIKNIAETPNNAVVAIPNDPSNQERALLLLQNSGLITLKPRTGKLTTPLDIVANPKHLKIRVLDAAQLPRVLPDVMLAVINTNYAVPAGLFPTKNGLFVEGKNSPYANVIVVRTNEVNNPKVKRLVEALHSPEVLTAAKDLFKGQAIPAWESRA